MCPAGNSGSGQPAAASKSFVGQLRDWVTPFLSPFRHKHKPTAAASPQSAFKRSRDEAFSIALSHAPASDLPPAQAPSFLASSIPDLDDPNKAKRPNLGQRVAELKEMHARQPMEPEPSRAMQPAAADHEGMRNHGNGRAVAHAPSVSALPMQQMLQGPRQSNYQESTLEPKALPFESPRQQQPHAAQQQQQQQHWQWQQRPAVPVQHRQLPGDRPWGILQTPYSTPGSSRPTPFNYQHPTYSRPLPSPMQPSMQPFRQPESRPASAMRSVLNRQSGRVSDPGFSLYQQLVRDFKPQPLPQAAQFLGMIDLSKSDEDFEKAALIGQRRKEREDERRQNTVQVLAQLQLAGSSQSILEARARSDVLERDVASLTKEKLVAARAAAARRRQEEDQHVRLIQESRRREEAEKAAAEEAERQRERQQQLAAEAAGDKKKKKKKKPFKKEEEAIVIESSEDEEAAPAAKSQQTATTPSAAVVPKRGAEPRRQQKGFAITPEESASWQRVFDGGAPGELLIKYRSVHINREKLLCLNTRQWLNDEAINMYMMLLQERDTALRAQPPGSGPPAPRCHFFSSYFLSKLYRDTGKYEYKQVQRWTTLKKLQSAQQASPNLLDVDRIVMPVNCGNVHWTCCMIDLQRQEFVYYDSMLGQDRELLDNLALYLRDEAKDKCNGRVLDTSSWKRICNPEPVPRQKNGCDCGVFTIMFADRLGLGQPFDFSQSDMDDIRIKVLHSLLSNKI